MFVIKGDQLYFSMLVTLIAGRCGASEGLPFNL